MKSSKLAIDQTKSLLKWIRTQDETLNDGGEMQIVLEHHKKVDQVCIIALMKKLPNYELKTFKKGSYLHLTKKRAAA